jgi:Clp amino terminal domain, pathogenicity island component
LSITLDGTMLDEQILGEARELGDKLLDLQHEEERTRADYQHAIRRLHAKGGSLREIADELGLSHQRVHQIVGEEPADPVLRRDPRRVLREPGRIAWTRKPFERFTKDARRVVTLAQSEAKQLGHNYIGTEHLLLGVLGSEGVGARALADFGVTVEETREDVKRIIGEGEERERSRRRRGPRMPFTPRSKKVLELSLRLARKMKDDFIGSEHIVLALVAEGEGVAAEILRERGVKEKELRRCVEALRAEN